MIADDVRCDAALAARAALATQPTTAANETANETASISTAATPTAVQPAPAKSPPSYFDSRLGSTPRASRSRFTEIAGQIADLSRRAARLQLVETSHRWFRSIAEAEAALARLSLAHAQPSLNGPATQVVAPLEDGIGALVEHGTEGSLLVLGSLALRLGLAPFTGSTWLQPYAPTSITRRRPPAR